MLRLPVGKCLRAPAHEKGRKQHGEDHKQHDYCVNLAGAPVGGDHNAKDGHSRQCNDGGQRRPDLGARWKDYCRLAGHPEIHEVDRYGGADLVGLAARHFKLQHLAQRQPLRADPQFAAAVHLHILFRQLQLHARRQLAAALQLRLHLVAHVTGVRRPVNGEAVAIEIEAGVALHAVVHNIFGGHQVGHEVALRREQAGEILHRLPFLIRQLAARTAALAHKGLVALHAHLHAAAGVQHAAAVRPQGHLQRAVAQIGLPFDVQGVGLRSPANIFHGRGRHRRLHDVRRKAV